MKLNLVKTLLPLSGVLSLVSCGPQVEHANSSIYSLNSSEDSGSSLDRLLPLQIGQKWTFQVSHAEQGFSGCKNGEYDMEITGKETLGGKEGFVTKGPCSFDRIFKFDDKKILVYFRQIAKWGDFLVEPKVGSRWQLYGFDRYWIKELPTFKGERASFEKCWQVSAPAAKATQTFCEDIGLVQEVSPGGGYQWDLIRKQ